MKIKFFNLFSLVGVLCLAIACKKEENKVYVEGSKPVALAASTPTIALTFTNAQKEVVKFSWNNPEYLFTTGVSSQDVTYKVEVDTTGANFTNPNKKVFSIGKDLSLSITDSALNDALLNQLSLKDSIPHNIEIRVVASLLNNTVPVISNTIKFENVIPYAIPPKVAVPSTGKLFITGSATPLSWQAGNGQEPEPPAQTFTRISDTEFELTVQLTGGQSYLLLPKYSSWDAKYGYTGDGNKNNPDGDEFKAGGNDVLAPAASGRYKINVDFQKGKFTVVKQ